jgi:hypothetical protein
MLAEFTFAFLARYFCRALVATRGVSLLSMRIIRGVSGYCKGMRVINVCNF